MRSIPTPHRLLLARPSSLVAVALITVLLGGLWSPAPAITGTPRTVDRTFNAQPSGAVGFLLIAKYVSGDSATFSVSDTAANGVVQAHGSPECHAGSCSQWATYDAPAAPFQSDSFTYTVTDAAGTSGPATVTMTYVPDAPLVADQRTVLNPISGGDVRFVAYAPDPHTVTFDLSSLPMSGTLSDLTQHGCDTVEVEYRCTATATYTPDDGTTSSDFDSFRYQAEDDSTGSFSGSAYSVITFEPAPVAQDDTVSLRNDRASVIDVLGNDTDEDGDDLSATYTSIPEHGLLTCAQTCSYTPDAGYLGPDSFTYVAFDGQRYSGDATVDITVTVPPPATPPPPPAAPPAPPATACVPSAPSMRSAAPGAKGGPVTAVVSWSAPNRACAGPISRFTVTATKINSRRKVVLTRTFTAAGSTHRLEMRLPSKRSWRFSVSATNRRGTSARSSFSNTVVAR